MFDYRCPKCNKVIERFVIRHSDAVECPECLATMNKLFSKYKYKFGVGSFFEAYVDTDIHPEGEPIQIRTQEEFFSQCRKYGRGYRKIPDRMR